MAKLTLSTITSGYGSVAALNANFAAIATAFENTLSRDGTTPNDMSGNIDMGGNRILNLGAPGNDYDPVRLIDLSDSDATGAASATLRSDLAASSGSSLVGTIATGTGAVARTVQSKVRDIVALADFSSSAEYDVQKLLLLGTLALPYTEFIKPGVGLPQIRLVGTPTRYATLRAGSDGLDDGDLYLTQTGDNVWLQSFTDTYRLTLTLVPKGTVNNAPANLELFSTDYTADATNWERLRIHTKGASESEHEIVSEKGGTGTVRPIHIYIGGVANGLYLGTAGLNGIGTLTPRRKLDILDASDPQLRLTHTDNTDYCDLQVDTDGNITVTPSGSGIIKSPASIQIHNGTGIPAGGAAGKGVLVSSTTNFGVFFGSGAPTLSAAKGSLYLRSDGTTTNDRAYINTDGGTTWTALTTAA